MTLFLSPILKYLQNCIGKYRCKQCERKGIWGTEARKMREFMRKLLFLFPLVSIWSGCTVSIIQTDTHGTATDVVDAEASSDADLEAEANIPVKAI